MIKKVFQIIFLILISVSVFGQRYTPLYSQYWINGLAINPAYAGSRECFSNSVMYRNQWVGFEGAPETQTLSSHTSLLNEKHSVGLLLFHEKIGVSHNYEIFGNYAFRFKLAGGKFALGLRAGTSIVQSNYSDVLTGDVNNDPEFSTAENEIAYQPNVGFGLYYYSDIIYLGASIPSFLSYKQENGKNVVYNNVNNYDFLLSAGILLGKSDVFKIRPTTLIRYRLNNTFQVDIGGNLIFYNAFWIGAAYRFDDEIAFMFEYQINDQIRLGGSYDMVTGDLAGMNSGSFELILRYEFKYKIRAVSPRFF
ncbi:MAG: type IX secretion system membrane protein PorP/SprF [Bacteroidales bacterium]